MRRIKLRIEGALLGGVGLVAAGLSGCGIGTAVVAAVSSGDDPGNSAPVISDASITDARTSPATVRFRLTDAEGDPLSVELVYQVPGEPETPMLLIGDSNLNHLATGPTGVVHAKFWDFGSQLPHGSGYEQGLVVTVRRQGGAGGLSSVVSGASIGNDAPGVLDPTPRLDPETQEARGIVLVDMLIADSSSDVVDLAVEFLDPDGVWQNATYSLGDSIPPIQATPTGRAFTFLWDSDVDGAEAEWTTLLRFTASDDTVSQEPMTTLPFAVDNNREPISIISELVGNPDRTGAIAVTFQIIDEESDPTPVVFQWRHRGETFPALPPSVASLEIMLRDPEGRRQHHICTEAPAIFRGRVAELPEGSDPDTQVRLPELASSGAILVAAGMAGRRIDLLRSWPRPRPVKDSWDQDPGLHGPVAILPVDDGVTALVLDGVGGSWNLREIDLATGKVISTLADASSGAPLTMAYEAGQKSVLVASLVGTSWQLHRVGLESGTPVLLASSTDGSTEEGEVRGIVSLGSAAALLTVGSSLVRVDFGSPGSAQATTLTGGLQTPWGIVRDPLHRNRIYLAERDYDPGPPASGPVGRVVALEFDSYERPPVVAWAFGGEGSGDPPGFPRPQALALERSGARLLAVTDGNTTDGTRELRSVDLGGAQRGKIVELGIGLETQLGEASGLGVGPEGLRALALRTLGDLAVGGGIAQSRTVIPFDPGEPERLPYDPATQVLTLGEALDPRPEVNEPWGILAPAPTRSSSPTGEKDVFIWDSGDAPGGGEVYLRLTPLGLSDMGASSESEIQKMIDHPWVNAPRVLDAGGERPQSIATGDLNGDGLLDLVCAIDHGYCHEGRLSIFFQIAPGEFPPTPDLTIENSISNPNSVAVSDLNGDGKQDLVCANGYCDEFAENDRLVIFLQSGTGGFGPGPDQVLLVGNVEEPADPRSVEVADLNGDGMLDLCSANALGDDLAIFFQVEPGYFGEEPLTLGDATTQSPVFAAAADLNGDGKLDLVSANSESHSLTIFLQGEPGTFGAAPDITLGDATSLDHPSSVVAADLNGDGLLDLATANRSGNNLVAFLQPAEGYVSTDAPDLVLSSAIAGSEPLFIDAVDLNGDGLCDLVSANSAGNYLQLFLQTAPGGFLSPPPLVLTAGGAQSFRAADLDGDGRLDLISANAGEGSLTAFFQTAPEDFSSEPDLTIGDALTLVSIVSLAAADLNGDRLLDLVTSDFTTGQLTVFHQASPGFFSTAPEQVLGEDRLDRPRYVAIADLNGDGRVDLVSANFGGDNLALFFQTAAGGFATIPDLTIGDQNSVDGPECVAAADLDSNGLLDLVSANARGDNLAVFLQSAPGTFPPAPDFLLGNSEMTDEPVFVIALDLDGDGLGDLASANADGDNLAVFFQSPSGGFSSTPDLTLGSSSTTARPVGLAGADLNGDGLVDLVSSNFDGKNLTVFFQTEPRQFSSTPDLVLDGPQPLPRLVSVSASDLNGDGLLDLSSANELGNSLIAYLQVAPGIFSSTPDILVGDSISTPRPRFLVTTDLNGDGLPDLVSANREGLTLTIFLNE